MRIHLLIVALSLVSTSTAAGDGDQSLRRLMSDADIVVLGEFTSEVLGECTEFGIVHYQGDFKISQLLKGEPLGDRRVGGTITANAIRFESEPADRRPELKQGGKCILFLTCNDRQPKPTYLTSDVWLGIQPASPAMAAALSRLAKESPPPAGVAGLSAEGRRRLERARPIETATELLARLKVDVFGHRPGAATVHAYCPPQPTQYDWLVTIPTRGEGQPLLVAVTNERKAWRLHPTSLERLGADEAAAAPPDAAAKPAKAAAVELHGEWRLFVPAGFEHEVTLKSRPDKRYRLTPGGLTFGADYEIQGDYLVSVPGKAGEGSFKWKINSPYLLTLVEQPKNLGQDYRGAVFVRPSIAAQIQLQREAAEAVSGVPKTTLDKQSFPFHPEVPASKLKIELTPAKTVSRKQKHLILPLTITNRSALEIQAKLAHEWHGGLWPPTAIYASVTPEDAKEVRPLHPVYRWGEDGKETVATALPPGKSIELQLRMDWSGTGSVRAMPLMEEPGRYHVRFALVFEAAGQQQYVITDRQILELPEETEHTK
jgi:hypothetical protein